MQHIERRCNSTTSLAVKLARVNILNWLNPSKQLEKLICKYRGYFSHCLKDKNRRQH